MIPSPSSRSPFFIWVLFFFSGACALVYEVLWTRHLGLILGNTVQSLAAVLSSFMAGLALGSFLAGRFLTGRRRLLLLYGALEVLIGCYCLVLPWLFEATAPLYGTLYTESGGWALPVARFALCFGLLLIPATFMGATLPLLTQHLVRSEEGFSRIAGGLYAVNTFGAVLGAALSGFFLLPQFGREGANWVAVAANLLLGGLAIVWGRGAGPSPGEAAAQASAGADAAPAGGRAGGLAGPRPESGQGLAAVSPFAVRAAALFFGVTGFAAMATQIGWTRALSLSLGSSTYAFSLIVSVFILGLALGGAWGSRWASRFRDPVGALAQVLLFIGCVCMALITLLGWAPTVFFWLISIGSQWGFGTLMALEALGIGMLLLIPTFLMGTLMPLTLHLAQDQVRRQGAGRTVGRLYALNTLGSILGSLAGGLVLLPLLQIEATLKVCALCYSFCGGALFRLSPAQDSRSRQVFSGILLCAAFGMAFLPGWDPLQMSSGAYLLRDRQAREAARRGEFLKANPVTTDRQILYYQEGAAATVAVTEASNGLTLSIGGKPDASSTQDMSTQIGLTLVPMLLLQRPAEEVLLIGMGSGVSLGAALAMPSLRRVDLLEISPEVMEASWFFQRFNGLKYRSLLGPSPLAEERVRVLINDGRNHLRFTSARYDCISSEPSNPWIAGIGNLFTREAFELCRARLKPGGVMCQWLHRYGLGEREFKSIFATFAAVFPQVQLWCVLPGSDFLLLGSDSPLKLDPGRIQALLESERAVEVLKRVNFNNPPELVACFLNDTQGVKSIAAGAPLHSDDNLLLEFAAPRTLYQGDAPFPVAGWRTMPDRILELGGLDEGERQVFLSYVDRAVCGRICFERMRDHFGDPLELTEAALALAPYQIWALLSHKTILEQDQARRPAGVGRQPREIIDRLGAGARQDLEPQTRARLLAEAYEALAREALGRAQYPQASELLQQAGRAQAERFQTALLEARLHALRQEKQGALSAAEKAHQRGAPLPLTVLEVAWAHRAVGEDQLALQKLRTLLVQPAAQRERSAAGLWALQARVLLAQGQPQAAAESLEAALRLCPDQPEPLESIAELARELGGLPGLRLAAQARELLAALRPRQMEAYLEWGQAELALGQALNGGEAAGRSEGLERQRWARCAANAARVLAPQRPEPCLLAARVWLSLGQRISAKVACVEALTLGGTDFKLPQDLHGFLEEELKREPVAPPQPAPPPSGGGPGAAKPGPRGEGKADSP